MSESSPQAKLARLAIEEYILRNNILKVPSDMPSELLNERAGVFVCLKKHGELRGCIGTIEPTRSCIAEEIIYNAISAATNDPRFPRVSADELNTIVVSVDVLTEPVLVKSLDELDPRKYGVIVESGFRRGLLLPDLDGVDTVDSQIEIASRKAGISPFEKKNLYKFEVKRYH